jgi:hypothetical protein
LKIGFVITLALSFNPVNALAEPVVIALPVVEETEWVMEAIPEIAPQTKPDLFDEVNPTAYFVEDRESLVIFFFRLIHYERLIKVHLDHWAIWQACRENSPSLFIINRLFISEDDTDFIV